MLKKKSQKSILKKLLRQTATQPKYFRKHLIVAALCFRKYGMIKLNRIVSLAKILNYNPVGVLSTLAKVFEKFMEKKVVNHVNTL